MSKSYKTFQSGDNSKLEGRGSSDSAFHGEEVSHQQDNYSSILPDKVELD